mmetsp:Transcript_16916/g.52472  ORF Transcript_16916/g.52472 Transcript_16916/m.52472 type:complete len:90 (-) Transcript_16916:70-339(-)
MSLGGVGDERHRRLPGWIGGARSTAAISSLVAVDIVGRAAFNLVTCAGCCAHVSDAAAAAAGASATNGSTPRPRAAASGAASAPQLSCT